MRKPGTTGPGEKVKKKKEHCWGWEKKGQGSSEGKLEFTKSERKVPGGKSNNLGVSPGAKRDAKKPGGVIRGRMGPLKKVLGGRRSKNG